MIRTRYCGPVAPRLPPLRLDMAWPLVLLRWGGIWVTEPCSSGCTSTGWLDYLEEQHDPADVDTAVE